MNATDDVYQTNDSEAVEPPQNNSFTLRVGISAEYFPGIILPSGVQSNQLHILKIVSDFDDRSIHVVSNHYPN